MKLIDMVIMPTVDYKNACDAIREKTETTDVIKSGEMAAAIRSIVGGASNLYIGTVRGADTPNISVDLPFKPDFVAIIPTDPYAASSANSFNMLCRDFRTFSRIGGWEVHTMEVKNYLVNAFTTANIERFFTYDGKALSFVAPNALKSFLWRKESVFTVIALNYVPADMSDEVRLKQYIDNLPNTGGSMTLSLKQVESAMDVDAFNAYVQAKQPNWTITLE